MVASANTDGKLSLKGVLLGHVNHFNFGGHQQYLWNGWSSRLPSIDGRSVWRKLVTVIDHSLSPLQRCMYWPSTSVYSTVSARHCVEHVYQPQRRLVFMR